MEYRNRWCASRPRRAQPEDTVIIFYAGHGYYDEDTELGYWLPADAEKEFTAGYPVKTGKELNRL